MGIDGDVDATVFGAQNALAPCGADAVECVLDVFAHAVQRFAVHAEGDGLEEMDAQLGLGGLGHGLSLPVGVAREAELERSRAEPGMADKEFALAEEGDTPRLGPQSNLGVFLGLDSGRAAEDVRAGVAGNAVVDARAELLGTEQNDALRAAAFADLPEMSGEGPGPAVLGRELVQLVRE